MTVSLQTQDNDCGVQALVTSLKLLGHDFPEPALRDALAVRGALSMRDLRDTSAEVCGVRYRARRDCPFDALTPGAIVHLRADHFITVERRRRRQVRIFDPSFGHAWLDERGYRERSSGWVLLPGPQPVTPGAGDQPAARVTSAGRACRSARASWLWPLVRSGELSFRQVVPLLVMSLVLYTGLTMLNLVLLPYLNQVAAGGRVAAGPWPPPSSPSSSR